MRSLIALFFCTCFMLFSAQTAAAQPNCQENDCPEPPPGEVQMLPAASSAVCSGSGLDACIDMGDLTDESYHALTGWGSYEQSSPIAGASGDRSKRFQSLNGDNSLTLRVPEANRSYRLVAEIENGGCDDSFAIYVNNQGPIYTYRHDPATTGVLSHSVAVSPAQVPGRDVRLTIRNLAGDWCGQAAVYNVRLEGGATPPELRINIPLDIVLVQDETGSMSDDIGALKTLAPQIWNSIAAAADVEFRFGVVGFRDYAQHGWGSSSDWVYQLHSDLTNNRATYLSGVQSLSASGGGDTPEAQYAALNYLLTPASSCIDSNGDGDCTDSYDTPADRQPYFRSGAQRIILLATDASAHAPENTSGYPGPGQEQVLAKLATTNAIVIGLVPGGAGRVAFVDALAAATGGSVQNTGSTGADVARAIINALELLRPVSAELSEVVAASGEYTADLTTRVPITVTLRDTAGVPVAGHTVQLQSNRPGLDAVEQPQALTDAQGQTVGYVRGGAAGVTEITALDLDDGVKITQHGAITFAAIGLPPNEDLQIAIKVQNDQTGRSLDVMGETTERVAAHGDYFKNAILPDKAKIVADLAFGGIDALDLFPSVFQSVIARRFGRVIEEGTYQYLRVVNIKQTYATAGRLFTYAFTGVEGMTVNYAVRALTRDSWAYWAAAVLDTTVEELTPQLTERGIDTLFTGGSNSMAQAANKFRLDLSDLKTDLDRQSGSLLLAVPPLSDAEQTSYADDLRLRTQAALALEDVYGFQARTLDSLRAARDAEDGFGTGAMLFVSRIGIQLASKLRYGGWFALIGYTTTYIETRKDFKNLATAEKAKTYAPGLMRTASDDSAQIYFNAVEGLDLIRYHLPVHTPDGRILGARHFEEGMAWNDFWEADRSYSEVDIINTGREPTLFTVLTRYYVEDTLFGLPYARINMVHEDSIWLSPNQTGTVTVEYLNNQFGVRPSDNSDIAMVLLAFNSSGVFRLGHHFSEWKTDRLVMSAAQGEGISAADLAALPSVMTPVSAYLYFTDAPDTYRAEVWVTNPFTATFTAAVAQPLPTGAEVISSDGEIVDGGVTWNAEVGAFDVVSHTVTFRLPAAMGSLLTLPAAQMSFVKPGSGQLIATDTAPTIFQAPAPFSATTDMVAVAYGAGGSLTVTLSNSSSSALAPAVRLLLRDRYGSVVYDETQPATVPAAGQTSLVFAMPTSLRPGPYDVEVWAQLGDGTMQMATSLYTVAGAEAFMPAVRK